MELQVLGLIGKLLTGPWMVKFYTSAETQVNHVDGIQIICDVVQVVQTHIENPASVLTCSTDFFGNELANDPIMEKLRQAPVDIAVFSVMAKACLTAVVTVLERQYKRYFTLDITEELKAETKSARSHNIDAEEVMGMFSAAQKKAPNATLGYL